MKKNKETTFGLVLFALLAIALISAQYWHSITVKQESVSISLREFDIYPEENSKSCFTLAIDSANLKEEREIAITAKLNSKQVLSDSLKVFKEEKEKKYCFEAKDLNEKNIVEVTAGKEKLFYHLKKGIKTKTKPEIKIEKIEKNTLYLYIKNFSLQEYTPIEIFVNNQLDHRVYPTKKEQHFEEKISLKPGKNTVQLKFMGQSNEIDFFNNEHFSMNPFIGIPFFLFGLFVFMGFVFSKRNFFEKIALSFTALLSLFIADMLFLDFFGLLHPMDFSIAVFTDFILIMLLFRKNFSLSKLSLKKEEIPFSALIAVFLIVFCSIAVHLFTPSYFTHFNVYYERQSNFISENGFIPRSDSLSYLGRNFSFVPGYFLVEGALSLLTGLQGKELFALTLAISNVFLFFSCLFFARTLKFSKEHSMLFFVFLSTSTFIFSMLTVTPRHAIALSFLLTTIALLLKYKNKITTALLLALTGFIQIPALLWFAFIAPSVQKKTEWKPFVKTFAIGLIAFAVLFLPVLLANGFPQQSRPTEWGYLIRLPLPFVLSDLGILFILFASTTILLLFNAWLGKKWKDKFAKKLFCIALISILIQAIISSRWNLVSSVIIALFLTSVISANKKTAQEFYSAIAGIILLGLYIAFLSFPFFTLTEQTIAPMQFLKQNTSTQEFVLADPFYSHAIAFISKRGTLADLCVEYADEQKLADSYEFLKTGNTSILKKYHINTVFNNKRIINEKVVDNKPAEKDIEFPELEKIYANEQFFVHRKIS